MLKPQGWLQYRISELGAVEGGRQRSRHIVAGRPRPYLRVANVFAGFIDTRDVLEMPFTDEEFIRHQLRPGDVLLNEGQSRELVGRSAIYRGSPKNCAYQNTLIRFRPNSLATPEFAHHLFEYLRFIGRFSAIASQTTSIAHLGVDRLAKLKVVVPPTSEQDAIARVLDAWSRGEDEVRLLLKARRKLKRGLLQQLLTGRRRFPEFGKQPWVERRLGSIVQRVTRTNSGGSMHALTISGTRGFVDQRKYFSKLIAGESIGDSYLIKRGEFAYNRSLMKGYPFGATKRLDEFDEGVVSKLYIIFAISDPEVDSDFLTHLFEAGVLNRQLCRITNLGSRAHGLLNIVPDDFFAVKVKLPPLAEQRRIAEVLGTLDNEIQHLRDLHHALKEQKKGLMQKLLTGVVRVPASMLKEATLA